VLPEIRDVESRPHTLSQNIGVLVQVKPISELPRSFAAILPSRDAALLLFSRDVFFR